MEARCAELGVLFQPLIFESLGGVSLEAERVIKSLNQAVAAATDSQYGEVATRFWQRVSIDIQRCQHRVWCGALLGQKGWGHWGQGLHLVGWGVWKSQGVYDLLGPSVLVVVGWCLDGLCPGGCGGYLTHGPCCIFPDG